MAKKIHVKVNYSSGHNYTTDLYTSPFYILPYSVIIKNNK